MALHMKIILLSLVMLLIGFEPAFSGKIIKKLNKELKKMGFQILNQNFFAEIGNNALDIQNNADEIIAQIGEITVEIGNNALDIQNNADEIDSNIAQIGEITVEIGNNALDIQNNADEIDSNIALIGNNTIDIGKNTEKTNIAIGLIQAIHGCFVWNGKQWIGIASQHPVLTVCGLTECVPCEGPGTVVELQIKTHCGKPFAGTNDDLLITFCNSDQCCSTGGIQLTNGIQSSNGDPVDCNTPDIFGSSQIGDCKDFEFGYESIITGNVTGGNDGFRGEWFKVRSSDGSFLRCTIDGWIDGDNDIPNESNVPKYQDFSCSSLNVCKGPNYVYLNEACYYVEKTLLSIGEAIENCQETLPNGRLFEPRDETTHNSVLAAALEILSQFYWIGINDTLSEGQFQYLSGGDLTFSNWYPGEPNDFLNNEDCATVQTNGQWNDVPCINSYGSICEVGK